MAVPNGRVGTTTSSPGATTAGSSVIHRSSSPGRGAPKPPVGATSQTISMSLLDRVYIRSPDGSIIAVPTMPPAPVRTSFSDHRPVAASMSHRTTPLAAPTVTPHVPSGATSRSIAAPGSASNCCRIWPAVSYSVTVPSLPRRTAPVGSARNSKNVPWSSVGASSGTTRLVSRSANATDLPGTSTSTAAVPSSDSSALRSPGLAGQVPRTPISRPVPSTRSTSTNRHVAVSPSVPATSSRARRPSGSTTAPMGSPPTSAPVEHLADGTVGVDRAHPRPRLSGAGGEHHGVGRRPGGGAPARPALVRLEDHARRVRRVDGPG